MVNTFGITIQTIRDQVQGSRIDTTTQPSTNTVLEMLEDAASEIERQASFVGIDVQSITDTTDATFKLLRRMTLMYTIADFLQARDRGGQEGSKSYRDEYFRLLNDLKKRTSIFQASELDRVSKRPIYSKEQILGEWSYTGAGRTFLRRQ